MTRSPLILELLRRAASLLERYLMLWLCLSSWIAFQWPGSPSGNANIQDGQQAKKTANVIKRNIRYTVRLRSMNPGGTLDWFCSAFLEQN